MKSPLHASYSHAKPLQWLLLPLLGLLLLLGTTEEAAAQGQAGRVVQLSGFVATGDSLFGVAGVSVYVPNSTRGTVTNEYGFFSVPVLAGDSVLFSALGFKKQYLIIPKNYSSQSYSIIMQLQEDPTELPMVDVFPWATERDFREAVANVKLPDEGRAIAMRNLDPERLEELFKTTPMDGAGNFRHGMNQQQQLQQNRYMYPTINPMAIPALIKSIMNGDFKQK
ncbi:carboxypeptidase-like regulatory domain-containing protein [Pontibacter diazotrophicus]|uniref:carboxypeptidase-like regulatory domain-containing protein n=1 Tax=Pontibacter diazotrophicus TaxID=1400979 RepID=UPI001FE4AD66|nr:carboxypeptidase-like regulatory domain-containing protein [Pontibacter diazotrophicus]